ncbi:sensor histidine kinase [Domibacillus indicus]|uniref:sensor histidine kinase n=1 Tax=Domibacillus indicus TaxID=1437523 RepID=UPI0006979E65|nr:sensor histidine kinase [Domibacillus indicus]
MRLKKWKTFIQKHLFFSFKSTIISLYLPVMILFIAFMGGVSYFLAADQIKENAYKNIDDTVFQTTGYMENRFTDVFDQLVSLANDPIMNSIIANDPEDISPRDYISFNNHLNEIFINYNSMIESILVDMHDGEFQITKNDGQTNFVHFDFREYARKFSGSKEGYYWRNLHEDDVFFGINTESNKVISVFKLIGTAESEAHGIVLFNLRDDYFGRIFSESLLGENGYLALISEDGSVLSKQVDEPYMIDEAAIQYAREAAEERGQFEFQKPDGKKMVVIYDTMNLNHWKVAAVFPEEDVLQKVDYIKYVTITIIVCLMIVASMLSNIFARYITGPIQSLVQKMKLVNERNIAIPVESSQHVTKEMNILNQGIEEMMQKLNELIDQVKVEQEEKRRLEYAILYAQITPHFLYNTLYSIKSLSDMGMNEEASAMISALSNFFRISISKGREMITVKEEIDHIQNYLFIQEMRYGDDFSYSIQLDESLGRYQIMKLTLQPLVENALYHGVKQTRGAGLIRVAVQEESDHLRLSVQDNGKGMPADKLEAIRREIYGKETEKQMTGIGLSSVHERIVLHFGPAYGLVIESEEGIGTTVTLTIPKTEQGVKWT